MAVARRVELEKPPLKILRPSRRSHLEKPVQDHLSDGEFNDVMRGIAQFTVARAGGGVQWRVDLPSCGMRAKRKYSALIGIPMGSRPRKPGSGQQQRGRCDGAGNRGTIRLTAATSRPAGADFWAVQVGGVGCVIGGVLPLSCDGIGIPGGPRAAEPLGRRRPRPRGRNI